MSKKQIAVCAAEGCSNVPEWDVQVLGAAGYRVPMCDQHARAEVEYVGGSMCDPWARPIRKGGA